VTGGRNTSTGDGRWLADPWLLLAFALPFVAVMLSLMQTEDLAYQIRAGELMWRSHSVLRSDPFTFTVAGDPWLNQQWGSQLLLAGVHAVSGWSGLVVVRAGIVGAAIGITYMRTRARGARPIGAVLLTFAPFVVCITLPGTLAMRPQLLAVPLFLAASMLLAGRRVHPVRLVWIPAIGVAWANLHGSFILLSVLCAVAFVADLADKDRGVRRTGLLVLVSLLVPLATPWGIHTYGYVVDLATAPIVRDVIDEWRPLWQQSPAGVLFAVVCAASIALLVSGGRRRIRLEDALTILVFTVLAAAGGRNLVWWSLAVPPAMGAAVAGVREHGAWSRGAVRMVAVGLALLIGIAMVRLFRVRPQEGLLSDAPLGITAVLQDSVPPGSDVFAGWWGSWLEFTAPSDRVFVDARAELFPQQVWDDYFLVSAAATGWQDTLDRWGVDAVVASHLHQAALIEAIAADPAWRQVYADDQGSVFVRAEDGSRQSAMSMRSIVMSSTGLSIAPVAALPSRSTTS
jgi:hypothetical protein